MFDEVMFDWKPQQIHEQILDPMIAQNQTIVNKILNEGADLLLQILWDYAPQRSQDYIKSWKKGQKTKNSIKIFSPMNKLFGILEYSGSAGAHIVPKNAKVLHWYDEHGNEVFRMWSNPKGFRPIPHLRPALRKFAQMFKDLIWKVVGEHVAGFKKSTTANAFRIKNFSRQYRRKRSSVSFRNKRGGRTNYG